MGASPEMQPLQPRALGKALSIRVSEQPQLRESSMRSRISASGGAVMPPEGWTYMLQRCFASLDLDSSGYIELREMRRLARQLTPQDNLQDATDMMRFADKDDDHKLSLEEFLDVMHPLSQSMTEAQFSDHIAALLSPNPHHAFNPPGYQHPAGCREWLQHSGVTPLLRAGLGALAEKLTAEQLSLAAGLQWQDGPQDGEGGQPGTLYLPHDWRPFCALRWLGNWLLQQLPALSAASPGGRAMTTPTFGQLTREEKVALAFQHLDRDNSGYLDAAELLSIAGKVRKDQDMEYAENLLKSMDLDGSRTVELGEYTQFCMRLMELLTDEEFDAAIHKVLGASHYSYCISREDKLGYLYREVHATQDGRMSYEQLVHLSHRLEPSATPWRIQEVLADVGLQNDSPVPSDAFVAALSQLLTQQSDDELDEAIISLIEGRKLGASLHPNDPLDEVEPPKYRQLLQTQALPDQTLEIGTMEVIDVVDSGDAATLLLVDVRRAEEVAVNTLPGAVPVQLRPDPGSPVGWAVGDVEPLRRKLASVLTQGSRVPRIVTFCSNGQRSAAASVLLSRLLGMAVRSLCGGIINYYNQGGRVLAPSGMEVQAIHPGDASLKAYIIRPNAYKLSG